ncbi:universal stress protein [Sphingomicrobium nitratireducens]|uniref:universal stress protein n=1 Tax=Sphingomicrobium nitratireducens TaxID=2964666 RepID=UPI00223FC402|nr:universal stress protein [Sphingomicrobium nitratireducens]
MKLLACLDFSQYATSVADHAAWVASRLDASVELLHVLQRADALEARRDLSGAIGLGARSNLMEELVSIEESQSRIERDQGAALLEGAAARLRDAGVIDLATLQRHGDIVETVIEREEGADLVVIGKRGEHADFARGHLGSKIERVVRQSVKPVLVASRAFKPIETVMVAFDGGPSAKKAVEFVAASPLFEGTQVHLVMIGSSNKKQRDALRWARETLGERLKASDLLSGDVEAKLKQEAAGRGADLVVMGAYGHSPLRSLIVGSTTTAMLRALPLPVLLFR